MGKSSTKHEHEPERGAQDGEHEAQDREHEAQNREHEHEHAAEIRVARFGALPDRVALADTVAEQPALAGNQAVDRYDPDGLGARFSCLAADWGL